VTVRSLIPRLTDIVEAIERVRGVLGDTALEGFEADWQKQWLVEELKARHPDIPWTKVAEIWNVLRHDYGKIAAPIMWKLVREELPPLEQVCRAELAAAISRES
jgi:uncharacterized protein with HEPN domain